MTGVRFREDTFEGQCHYCRSWWALTVDNWFPKNGLQRCRPCMAEYKRLKERGYSQEAAHRELKLVNGRIAYRLNREERLAYNRKWKAANRDKIAAYNAAYRARAKAA